MRFLTPELRSVIAKKLTARLDLFFFNLPGNTSTLLSSEEIKILRAVFFSLGAMMYLKGLLLILNSMPVGHFYLICICKPLYKPN